MKAPENLKPTLSVEECQVKLMTTLDLSGLDKWPEEKVKCTHELLMEYHDIFSLAITSWGALVRSNITSR